MVRTSVEISDALMEQARIEARLRSTTLRALIEEGLRAVLDRNDDTLFEVQDASFQGKVGYAHGVNDETIGDRIREALHAGREG